MRTALVWNRRSVMLGVVALVLLLGALLLGAPAASRLESGSTWHRGPAGYSAWYKALEQQGVTVQRWQRPVSALLEQLGNAEDATVTLIQHRSLTPDTLTPEPIASEPIASEPMASEAITPETLVAVLPGFIDQQTIPALLPWMSDWMAAGHRLVVLGWKVPTTAAPFSQTLTSDVGPVQIDTRRRRPTRDDPSIFLEDQYGAVAWQQEDYEAGQFIAVATPHLAANAYLNQPGNFALLTDLVTRAGGRVWIDEYLHGYRDAEAVAADGGDDSWLSYLARTPLLILGLQALAVNLLAILAFNRRLGQRQTLSAPKVDNSQAYIQALAGVLHKAGSHDFVVQTLSQAERLTLQKALGLGHSPVPVEHLQSAWEQQSGRSGTELQEILQPPIPRAESQLRDWLQRLQSLQSLKPGDSNQP